LAKLVHINAYHLAHTFKEDTGMAPIQYLVHCRIEESKKLLTYSDLSISEIAMKVGYPNANYFNLLFKKMAGVPPGVYRKKR
jgi:AraC-like DNA-binding protein